MLTVSCSGTPYEIGQSHGKGAERQIRGSIAFYQRFFKEKSDLGWAEVVEQAEKSLGTIEREAPHLIEEMRGIADACHLPFSHVLALNVRTEIAYGLAKVAEVDGCTTLSFSPGSDDSAARRNSEARTEDVYLAQNWDWRAEQEQSLIRLLVEYAEGSRLGSLAIDMVTEAGIIGKIGLNSNGVGVCLNAIKASGVDWNRLPVHVALRLCLESSDAHQAAQKIKNNVASACSIFVADQDAAIYTECSHKSTEAVTRSRDVGGWLIHTNHYLIPPHPAVVDDVKPSDTKDRLERAGLILQSVDRDPRGLIGMVLNDRQGAPGAIFRSEGGSSDSATLFTIIMNLTKRVAQLLVGQPDGTREDVMMDFAARV